MSTRMWTARFAVEVHFEAESADAALARAAQVRDTLAALPGVELHSHYGTCVAEIESAAAASPVETGAEQ